MKRLLTILLGISLVFSFVRAQDYWDKYLVNENFNGWLTWPTGWGQALGTGGGVAISDSIRISGAGSGNRGADILIPAQRDSSVIYLNFDLFVAASTVARNNAMGLFISGTNSGTILTASAFNDLIAGVYLAGTSNKFHIWNMDIKGPVPASKPDTIVPAFYTGSFGRPAKTNAWCDSINTSTKTNVDFLRSTWYNLLFKFDFVAKKFDVTITQRNNELNTQTITGLDFYSKNANDIRRIGMTNTRGNSTYPGVTQVETDVAAIGNGGNANLSAFIDNLKVYQKVKSLGNADVTVNYLDQDGSQAKAPRIAAAQQVGQQFRLNADDKLTFTENGNYYAYDAVATGSDSVLVVSGANSINVKFKKAAVTAGTYSWVGSISENWNELDANFSTNGTNQMAFQNGNGVVVADANAPLKNIVLNQVVNLGEGNLTIDAADYNISGTGKLTGTGAINVNASVTLGLFNDLTGGINLNNGSLGISHLRAAKSITAKNGTTLSTLPGVGNFNTPITGEGTLTWIPKENSYYSSRVIGVKEMNYVLSVKGSPHATTKGMPILSNVLDSAAVINVTTIRGDSTYFGPTIDFKYNKINLGDSIDLVYGQNPVAGGTTTVTIGELTGKPSSRLVGCYIRTMTYNIGTLNTDAVFEGQLKPVIMAWFNTSATDKSQTNYNISKVGKGKWTLKGNSPKFLGNVKVLDGTLVVDSVLCDGVGEYVFGTTTLTTVPNRIPEVLVADTATLAGKGFIGASVVNVNGTITGNLTVGGTLSLKPDVGLGGATTVINVNSTGADKITVTGDLYYGGKLVVKVQQGARPQPGTFKILEFSNFVESGIYGFNTIELPSSNWTFDYTTGMLTYKGGDESAVKNIDYSKPIDSIEYFDITGKRVTKHQTGLVITKVVYNDGSSVILKSFVKK